MEILATGFSGIIDWVNLYVKMLNIAVIGWYAIYAATMLGMNWMGMGEPDKQKQRKKQVISSWIYAAVALIIFDVIFGVIALTKLDSAADSSNDKVSNFLEKQAEDIEKGNYKGKLNNDSDNNYDDTDFNF